MRPEGARRLIEPLLSAWRPIRPRNGAGMVGVGLLREVTVLSPHVPRPLLQTTSTEGPGFCPQLAAFQLVKVAQQRLSRESRLPDRLRALRSVCAPRNVRWVALSKRRTDPRQELRIVQNHRPMTTLVARYLAVRGLDQPSGSYRSCRPNSLGTRLMRAEAPSHRTSLSSSGRSS
jgi:hypothetical protein